MLVRAKAYAVMTLLMVVALVLPDSVLKGGMQLSVFAFVIVDHIFMARSGYRRRRPYWTRDSWRRFLWRCTVPVAAWIVLVGMVAAVEYRLPTAGASHSGLRAAWVVGILVAIVIAVHGTLGALHRLNSGDPTQQLS